ncbi:MAG: restriction endonuclease [Clostridia bacterium]|nr:restriction endonuclease [Clostridia bacterium]
MEKETKTPTRAEKREAAKTIIREILQKAEKKNNDLIDEAAKIFSERFGDEETDNANDVKGRIGSVLDLMKKDGEVRSNGGMCALNAPAQEEKTEEKPKAKRKTAAKKAAAESVATEEKTEEKAEEKPKAKRTRKTAKAEEPETEKIQPLPPAPVQPIAPVAPITPEVAPEPIPEKTEEKPAPKKRARKTKTAEMKDETPAVAAEEKAEVKEEPKAEEQTKEKAEVSPKGTLMDMSFLFGEVKPVKKEEKPAPKAAETPKEKPAAKAEVKAEVKPTEKKTESKPQPKNGAKERATKTNASKKPARQLTADEKLQDAFLSRLHKLGGEYFEYYSIYLLEKYSRMNGRRLESLQVTAGDHDGGIDGEIELTDRLGFRETIYIQAKNWDPSKGDEKLWVVGETLLQQFIGACVCRQAKDGKQHCRGIFITTSRFTPEAKRMLDDTSDKFVGYDGADLYETAKECGFGIVKKNGEWVLDENLLSGTKAFFNMY